MEQTETPREPSAMSRSTAIAYAIGLPLSLLGLTFLPAGTIAWLPGWIFLAVLILGFGASALVLARVNPIIYTAHAAGFRRARKAGIKALLAVILPAMVAILPVAGARCRAIPLVHGSGLGGRCSGYVARAGRHRLLRPPSFLDTTIIPVACAGDWSPASGEGPVAMFLDRRSRAASSDRAHQAAVDANVLSGDVGGTFRRKERDGRGDFLGLPVSLHRNALAPLLRLREDCRSIQAGRCSCGCCRTHRCRRRAS